MNIRPFAKESIKFIHYSVPTGNVEIQIFSIFHSERSYWDLSAPDSWFTFPMWNKPVLQMRVPLAACREPVGSDNRLSYVLFVFKIKRIFLTHFPYTRIVVFRHNNMYP